ncbi:DUF4942 domain-containing protein [Bradyrhizobium sp.]|uniref:DUF4942 domain-containing protein n=1 Tax=Bradyrhizobium sp. TaxID=376 RepID=UPI00273630AD|nr:DUF4942 domain-containing protein [Bradyrhizobium sp.]MDP3078652.1 DUF4942 domain-containing protein [Bradyrhizobium sp.]
METFALVSRATVEEIVGYRNQALSLYEEAWGAIETADQKIKAAALMAARCNPSERHFTSSHHQEIKDFYAAVCLPDRERYSRVARRLIDTQVWAYMVERTDLERLMDKEAKDQLRQQMAYIPEQVDRHSGEIINEDEMAKGLPPATVENIHSTLQMFIAESNMIFRRGIANAFSKLDRRFKSHDGFKVGGRIILTNAFSAYGGWSYTSHHRDTLIDIERTFSMLDGNLTGSYTSAIGAIEQSRRGYQPHQSETETSYFRIRGFKNGNAHLWFLRDDLVEKVNRLLAEYYGEVIGDKQPTEEDPLGVFKLTPAKNFGFYPTPPEACDFALKDLHIASGMRVLEPSAGTGHLAGRCLAGLVDCVEIQPDLAKGLDRLGVFKRVYCQDFLTLSPDNTGLYDRVVMNPPFDRERDIDHVMHALKFLKPDGFLIAIMSAGTDFRGTKKAQAFRTMMQQMHATYRDLPAGSFSSVGTYVNTIAMQVWKDGREQRWNGGRKFGQED